MTRVSNAVCSRSSAASPRARLPKRKFSPTDTQVAPSRAISSWSMNSCAVCAIRSPSNGITISSSTPEAGDQVGLLLERGEQLGRGLRRHDRARVRLEGQHAVGAGDHGAVADVHAVELAHGEPALARRRIGQPDGLHARKPTTGFRVAPPRGSASAIRPSASRSRQMPVGAAGNRGAVGRLLGVLRAQLDHGHERQRVVERDEPFLGRVLDVEVADPRPAQLDAVRVVAAP